MKLVVLCDDHARTPFAAEHGFSLWIETKEGSHVLFDTGTTNVFMKNATLLGIDLRDVTDVVLSHGHYDHVGGLGYLLEVARPRIWVRRGIDLPKYSKTRYTGAPYSWEEIRKMGASIEYVDRDVVKISDTVFVWGPAKMTNSFEEPDPTFLVKEVETMKRDYFEEELNLTLKTSKGLVVVTGCAHRGIVNIASEAKRLFGEHIHLLLGGFHLVNAPLEKIQRVVEKLNELGVENIAPCHCTGEQAIQYFKSSFKGNIISCQVGTRMVFE
ncbi:MBL fold metallo-hydrolase [Thermotoga sp.]|uniref:MBL fold metallo-hydrolase n=1 Tax=Thermotoga sp. TaxID=28240 RepID=UPI00260071F1|nr:MBL fold metallo-hydrolase [Thermotoga sp.]MCD6550905.1 MBL fold metallo-hydrolase [Thermotoga sp.]